MIYLGIGLAVIVIALIIKNKKIKGDGKKDISADTILPNPPKPPKGEEPK